MVNKMVTCHCTANRCCETFLECCETFLVCRETFIDCCESFSICDQTFAVNDNGQDKLKGWVRGIFLLGSGSKVVENNPKDLKKVSLF